MIANIINYFAATGAGCSAGKGFLGLPTWYTYLEVNGDCTPKITGLSDVWLIVAAIIEILLRIAAMAAVVFVIVGAVEYIMSQGEPEKTAKARGTIVNALVGLVVAVIAATLVGFIAGRFH